MEDQAAYFRRHPPRCIAGFVAQPTTLPGVEFDGHASPSQIEPELPSGFTVEGPEHINTVFGLSCPCRGGRFFIHGYQWVNPDYHNASVALSPLVLECEACGKRTDLLDTDVHGYNSELELGSSTARATGKGVVFECPTCGRQPFDTLVRFEYPDELFDGDYPEFAGREQDLFSWFSLVGRCARCSRFLNLADFECA